MNDLEQRQDDPGTERTRRSAWRTSLAAIYIIYLTGLLALVISSPIREGRRIDALRNAPGAHIVTMTVTGIRTHCYKGCTYTSVGHYTDPATGQAVDDVTATPSFQEPAYGPLQVIVSPAHKTSAVRADYTAAGYIATGVTFLALGMTGPLIIAGFIIRLLHRRARVRRTLAAVSASAEPTGRFTGVLRGPGIPSVIGVSSIELTPTELIEYEHHLGAQARWRVALTHITNVQLVNPVNLGVPHPMSWQTLEFHTAAGEYALTCDPMYLPLLREALTRHAPETPDADAGAATDADTPLV